MSNSLSCGFAKVAVYNILSSKLSFDVVGGEKHNEYKAKLLKIKYNEYATYFYNITSFNVEYRQFTRNFPKITDNIKPRKEIQRSKKGHFRNIFKNSME